MVLIEGYNLHPLNEEEIVCFLDSPGISSKDFLYTTSKGHKVFSDNYSDIFQHEQARRVLVVGVCSADSFKETQLEGFADAQYFYDEQHMRFLTKLTYPLFEVRLSNSWIARLAVVAQENTNGHTMYFANYWSEDIIRKVPELSNFTTAQQTHGECGERLTKLYFDGVVGESESRVEPTNF